jgi:hypothetical protein
MTIDAVYSKHAGKNDKVQLHGNFSKKSPNTSKKSHAHLQCVYNNYARFIMMKHELDVQNRKISWKVSGSLRNSVEKNPGKLLHAYVLQ